MVSSLADRKEAVRALAVKYWEPIYWYIRAKWSKGAEDSKDLTQAFLVWLLEGDALQKYSADRGSFRNYMKMLLKGFVGHHEEGLRTLKRGGGALHLPLAGLETVLPDPRESDPERAFNRAWVAELTRRAIERVRLQFGSPERAMQFRVFEAHDLVPRESRPSYAALAKALGLREDDVRHALAKVRESMRVALRTELADLVGSDEDLEKEWNDLFLA
jgi:hypothetical protein